MSPASGGYRSKSGLGGGVIVWAADAIVVPDTGPTPLSGCSTNPISLNAAPPTGFVFQDGSQRHVANAFVLVVATDVTDERIVAGVVHHIGVEVGKGVVHKQQVVTGRTHDIGR